MNPPVTQRPVLATYRLQLHSGFGFDDAAALVDYLAALGVSHLYSSPVLQATRGSTHGYDVVDPRRVSAELGGAAGFERLSATLREHQLGLVVDIVPNHMAITGPENAWWWDVLENGPASRFAAHFDVDWDPPEAKLRNMVLVPILADHYGRALEAGDIRLERVAAGGQARVAGTPFVIRYAEHALPVAPRTLDVLLADAAERAGDAELAGLAGAFGRLPPATATDRESVTRRHRDTVALYARLDQLLAERRAVAATLDVVVAEVNGEADRLHEMLERQNYRLAFWRTAARELGYRRFFDVATLAGLRVEDEVVFADTHALVLAWLTDGTADGVRVDHPDGLRDPDGYFRRLRGAAPRAWMVIEKILARGEALRTTWPVDGTTGYEFLARVGSLFIDPEGEAPLTATYAEFSGETADFAAVAREGRLAVMREALASDVNRLTALLVEVCERHRRHRDYTRHELHEAVRELVASYPVYRTYVRPGVPVHGDDRRVIVAATDAARAARPDLDPQLFDFLRELLLLQIGGGAETELAMRVQQLSGPVMAKGVEDTALYRFNRLVGLNEVGGDPAAFGGDVAEFHAVCQAAQAHWPSAMLATSTHDTKRSEDVRARLALLSEMPARWEAVVRGWAAHNDVHREGEWPDRNLEYLLYQTLVGAWPIERARVLAYVEKAAREAKLHTSWTRPGARYESAVRAFVEALFDDAAFLAELEAFVGPLIGPGRINSLSQTLLKLSAPGVPDLYQGTELWDLSLVDPDNRRPVDFARRRALLRGLDDATPERVWAGIEEGLPKLWVIRQVLALRCRRPQWFGAQADYVPLAASGRRAAHAVAFVRAGHVASVVPRLVWRLAGDWQDTTIPLPAGKWRNWLSGENVAGGAVGLAELLRRFPVALLEREG
jgi:(1->4)-alpha-D-glucan 1-alpha-D-glucosylmutase